MTAARTRTDPARPAPGTLLTASDDAWTGRAPMESVVGNIAFPPEEVVDGLLMVPGFSHAFAVRTTTACSCSTPARSSSPSSCTTGSGRGSTPR